MTDPVVKTFAQFDGADYRRSASLEITDLQAAVEFGIMNNCSRFRIFEQTSVTVGGKTMSSEPEYKPGSYKLFVDKVMTAADIAGFYEKRVADDKGAKSGPNKSGFMADEDKRINRQMRDQFKSYPADKPFYDDPFGRGEEFCTLEAGDVAFNREGRQLWPVPAPSVAVDHTVTPMKKISLKPPRP